MKMNKGLRLLSAAMVCLVLLPAGPMGADAAEPAGHFILVAEAGGPLVIAPEYIPYTQGQSLGEVLEQSGHTFTGMDQGQITAIDEITGNFTRSDQNGEYDLSVPASSVTHFRFSENVSGSKPSEGLLKLMTAMADYQRKAGDVRRAAQTEYNAAKKNFVGCSSDDAKTFAYDLNTAVREYENTLSGTKYAVTFTDGKKPYTAANYPGVSITAEDPYGKVWTDDGDGVLDLPVGSYRFCVEQDGLRVVGDIVVSADTTIRAQLPGEMWLKLDAFRLSGSYGAESNEEYKFSDAEFTIGAWNGRENTVLLSDLFKGAVYSYAEFDANLLDKVPGFTAIYTMVGGEQMEKKLAFESMTSGRAVIELDGTLNTQTVTIAAENPKAPEGTGIYTLNILKCPPVEVTFVLTPGEALLNIYEIMSAERLWADDQGAYQLFEGYAYNYTLTRYGYVGKSGTLKVTRNDKNELILRDGAEEFSVTQSGDGGVVTIVWTLDHAPVNSSINPGLSSDWPNFRGSGSNNAVTDAPIPTVADDSTLYWASKLGSGFDSDAVGSPILVDGDLITYAGNRIFRVDTVTGEVLATGTMDHKSSFSITPPTYAEGIVFVALSNGCVQAFNAATLESLWIYADPLGGQPNCPLTVKDGYLYIGFWNSETGDANFVCMTITGEDPSRSDESKCVSWYQTAKGGYYWAGAYVGDGFVLVGTDDGTNRCNENSSSLLLLDAKTGKLLDRWNNLNGDIRSTIVHDAATDAFYFTSKGGTFYSIRVENGRELKGLWSVALKNSTGGIPMSTCSPVVYNGRAYVGVSGSSQFGAYSGHNITVLDLQSRSIAYSIQTQGYPQTSGLLTTAYAEDSGYTYVYFFDNMTPGKLRILRDKHGMTSPDYLTMEKGTATAYALFTPTGEQAQYAICSPIVDAYGSVAQVIVALGELGISLDDSRFVKKDHT